MSAGGDFVRRAQPLLGTLVEVGARGGTAGAAVAAAFARIARLQARLSRFAPGSDIARFNALPGAAAIDIDAETRVVLRAARRLHEISDGAFDVSLGSGSGAWSLQGQQLCKHRAGVALDLGGIAKGYAVDCAAIVLRGFGCRAGWVNAGGDLRAFGDATLTLQLRDEAAGGVRAWGRLRGGACATSRFATGSRSTLAGGDGRPQHLSVLAPRCLWADALTKVAALHPQHPALRALGATAWQH